MNVKEDYTTDDNSEVMSSAKQSYDRLCRIYLALATHLYKCDEESCKHTCKALLNELHYYNEMMNLINVD